MKKVGILTITDGSNYGNRLQNYAMQKLLESIVFQVETNHTVGSDPIKFLLIIFWLLVGFGENALFKIHFNVTLLLLMNNRIWQSDEVIRKDVEIVEME